MSEASTRQQQDCPSSSMQMCARFIKVLSLSIKSLYKGEVAKQHDECTVHASMRKYNYETFHFIFFSSLRAAGVP